MFNNKMDQRIVPYADKKDSAEAAKRSHKKRIDAGLIKITCVAYVHPKDKEAAKRAGREALDKFRADIQT